MNRSDISNTSGVEDRSKKDRDYPAPPSKTTDQNFSIWWALQTVIFTAMITAFLLTMWTPANLFSDQLLTQIQFSIPSYETPAGNHLLTPTSVPKARIGIVAGHWGNDSGAVCPDGLTEADVNLRIATLVKQYLLKEGYQVDLLQEFDKRLSLYQAIALVSIHNDSCDFINDDATGFKVAAAMNSPFPEKTERLSTCMIQRYQAITGMKFHYNTITPDMTSYHAFNEISSSTTAVIIETGFLNLDRQILTEHPDVIAKGITAGILCYVRNEPVTLQETPTQ